MERGVVDPTTTLDLRQSYERGWMAYRPRLQSSDLPETREPWFAAGFPSPALAVYPPADISSARPSPFEYVLEHIFRHILSQLHIRPLGALRSAIEDKLGSKIFVRNSDYLSGRFRAISKYCLMRSFLNPDSEGPLAFYATVVRPPSVSETCDARFLQYRLTMCHEFLHHYLHIAPELQKLRGDQEAFRVLDFEYKTFLAHGVLPHFGPDPERAELEADLSAFFLLLAHGYLVMKPRVTSAMRELYRSESMIDHDLMARWVERYSNLVPRPRSVDDFQVAKATGRQASKVNSTKLDDERLVHRVRECVDSLVLGIARPYSWACTSIEHLFRGEGRSWRNVSIKLVESEHKEPFCTIERINLQTVLEKNSELRRNWHLLKYVVHYPYRWDLKGNPEDRISLLQWLGLIDLCERRNPPSEPVTQRRTLSSYSADDLAFARLYAIAIDVMTGDPSVYQPFFRNHAVAMLAGSAFSLEQLESSPWQELLSSFLGKKQDLIASESQSSGMEIEALAEEATQSMEDDEAWYWNSRPVLQRRYGSRGYLAVLNQQVIDFDKNVHKLMRRIERVHGSMSFYLADLALQERPGTSQVLIERVMHFDETIV